MSSKFWVSSEDLSVDSSVEGSQGEARDASVDESQNPTSGVQSQNLGTVARANSSSPNLQHASLLYLSLIEGRCRTQARNTINAGRHPNNQLSEDHPDVCSLSKHLFTEITQELVKGGLVPREFAGLDVSGLLQLYSSSFDSLLNNITTQPRNDVLETPNYPALDGLQSLTMRNNSSFSFDSSQGALIKATGDRQSLAQQAQLPWLSILSPGRYKTQYQQISPLGKGGFGQVFKAKYCLDKAEYAIKEIYIPAVRFNELLKNGTLSKVLEEAQALAKLDHHHIVRYFHSWIETRTGGVYNFSSDDDEESSSTQNFSSQSENVEVVIERDLIKGVRRARRESASRNMTAAGGSMIVFSNSLSSSTSREPSRKRVTGEDSSSQQDSFRNRGEHGSNDHEEKDEEDQSSDGIDENEDTEEIVRSDITARFSSPAINVDALLYIKMTPYPLSLEDFIWPDQQENEARKIAHCFHPLASIHLILAILEGVEYLHLSNIIHRDLKPANVFLSILQAPHKPTQGFIDIAKCPECNKDRMPTFICPRIGDFGLIHDLRADPINDSVDNTDRPYPFCAQVGTKHYIPLRKPKELPFICSKLDVYALGIISFELVYRFGTKTERNDVLSQLRESGMFPSDFRGHVMKDGIANMIHWDRSKRWGTTEVRTWLEELKKALE